MPRTQDPARVSSSPSSLLSCAERGNEPGDEATARVQQVQRQQKDLGDWCSTRKRKSVVFQHTLKFSDVVGE